MKRIASILTFVLFTTYIMAQTEQEDTLLTTQSAPETIIQHHDTHQTDSSPLTWDFAKIEGRDSLRHTSVYLSLMCDMNAGWVLPMGSPADMKFRHWTYMEGEFNFLKFSVVPSNSQWWYDLKYGIGLSTMEMKKSTMAYTDRDGNLLFGSYPTGTEPKESMIRTMSSNFTLMAHRRFSHGSSLGLGITMRHFLDRECTTRTEYIDTDGKKSVVLNEFGGMRRVQWSAIAQYNIDQNLYFFIRFAPWGKFHKGSGPDYSSMSIGLGLKF